MKYIIVSAFTPHPVYEEKALNFATSLNNLDLEYEIYPLQDRGSWAKNCQQKAEVILDALRKHKKPVVWIDIDAVVVRQPELFDRLTQDICDVAYYAMKEPERYLASGTLYFGYTQGAISILEQWIDLCKDTLEYDQKVLEQVIWNEHTIPKSFYDIIELPVEYCRIFDNKAQEKEMKTAPVVVHTQASRQVKQKRQKIDTRNKSILICGNGGSLPKHISQLKLDKFEFICRLNNYRTNLDVGERTDIWSSGFWYDISPKQIIRNRNKIVWDTMMFGKCYAYKPEWRQEVFQTLGRAPDKIMSQNDYNELKIKSTITSPSTGLRTVHLALGMNMKITLAGFDFFSPDVAHHYFNVVDIKSCPHKGELEKNYILYLEEQGVLNVIK